MILVFCIFGGCYFQLAAETTPLADILSRRERKALGGGAGRQASSAGVRKRVCVRVGKGGWRGRKRLAS